MPIASPAGAASRSLDGPAAPAAPERRRLAFVPDIDELAGGFARGTQQVVGKLARSLCDGGRRAMNGALGRPLVSPAQSARAAYGVSLVAGQGVLLGGAWLAATACHGARDNVADAARRRQEWLHIERHYADGPGEPAASACRLARREARAARWQHHAYAASAVGAAAMAAVLVLSLAPVVALGAWVGVVNAVAMGTAVGAMGAYGLVQAGLAMQRLRAAQRVDAALAELGQPAEAEADAAGTSAPSPGQLARARGLLVAPTVSALAAGAVATAGVALLSPPLLQATAGCAAVALGAAATVLLIRAARAQHDERAAGWLRQLATPDRLSAQSAPDCAVNDGDNGKGNDNRNVNNDRHADALGAQAIAVMRSTLRMAADAEITIAVGGVLLAVGLVLQLSALWTGIAAISLGSAVLEISNAVRETYAPTLWPWTFAADEASAAGAHAGHGVARAAEQAGSWAAWQSLCERAGPTWLPTPLADALMWGAGRNQAEARLRQIEAPAPVAAGYEGDAASLAPFVDAPWPQAAADREQHARRMVGAIGLTWTPGAAGVSAERTALLQLQGEGQTQAGLHWSNAWQRLWTHPQVRAAVGAAYDGS